LLRHAKSSWDDADLPDRDRPLAKRGERDAPRIAKRLREHLGGPTLIVTSPARRALRTARLVALELDIAAEALAIEAELYLAAPAEIVAVAARQTDEHRAVMLVGHNPGFTELASRLTPDLAIDNLPTAGVVVVDFAIDRWASLPDARGELAYFDYPKNPDPPRRR
jgi:phosphohistidine phosphatase